MPDWLIAYLGSLQGGIVRTLAVEMRAGGMGTMAFAFGLGALHALTPGHGKAALAAYFLGREAHITKGLRIALTAALLHVLSGFAAFLILCYVIAQVPSMWGRGSPTFTLFGYGLIIVANRRSRSPHQFQGVADRSHQRGASSPADHQSSISSKPHHNRIRHRASKPYNTGRNRLAAWTLTFEWSYSRRKNELRSV